MADLPAHLSAAEKGALADFLARVRALLGDELLGVRLFGSRARGEGGEDSDLDVALIVTPRGRQRRRDIHGLTFEAAYDFGIDVQPLVLTEEQLDELARRELRIATVLEREGVPL